MEYILLIYKKNCSKKIEEAYNFAKEIAAEDGEILFVGTKKTSSRGHRS